MYESPKICARCRQEIEWTGAWSTIDDDAQPWCRHVPRRTDGVYQLQARSSRDSGWDVQLRTLVWGTEQRERSRIEEINAGLGWERYRVVKIRDL